MSEQTEQDTSANEPAAAPATYELPDETQIKMLASPCMRVWNRLVLENQCSILSTEHAISARQLAELLARGVNEKLVGWVLDGPPPVSMLQGPFMVDLVLADGLAKREKWMREAASLWASLVVDDLDRRGMPRASIRGLFAVCRHTLPLALVELLIRTTASMPLSGATASTPAPEPEPMPELPEIG